MSQTADRYSKALFELAQEQHCLETVQISMTDLRRIVLDSEDFRHFLNNPLLTYDDHVLVLKALFEGKVPELSYKFLRFITYKGRLHILKEIIESFDQLYLKSTNQVRAYVTTASVLEKEDRVIINQHLRDKFQSDMLTKWNTDPSLIGGFRIYVQGKIYDYSFKNQLNHFFQHST